MPKMADFGAWRGENLPRQGRGGRRTGRNGAGRGEKADFLPSRPLGDCRETRIHANGADFIVAGPGGAGQKRNSPGPTGAGYKGSENHWKNEKAVESSLKAGLQTRVEYVVHA